QNLGLDQIRTVTVHHHEKQGHHHHGNHHHGDNKTHHHPHHRHTDPRPDGDHTHDDHSHDDHSNHTHDDHNDHSHDDHSHNDHSNHTHDDHSHDDHSHNDHSNHTHDDHSDHSHDDHSHNDHSNHTHDDHSDHSHDDHSHDDHMPERLHPALLSRHGPGGRADAGDFGLLCPALLDQLDRGACVRHGEPKGKQPRHHHGHHNHSEHSEAAAGESSNIIIAWVGGFLSISIISLLSLAGVVLIPLMNKVFFNFLLSFLVALAVGTLSGDAFLHLIPHVKGLHSDHEDHGDHAEDSLDGVWKGLTALGGVYIMFLIEHFLTLGKMYKDKKNKNKQQDQAYLEKQAALEENLLKNNEGERGGGGAGDADPHARGASLSPQGYSEQDCENKCHSHFHDTVGQPDHEHHHHHDYHHILHHHHSQNHHPHSHTHSHGLSRLEGAGVASLAWMVVMGDGLHNFSDGLAIGAAFTEGLSSGLSTSVAVFCHELPHELGDFAVLLKAGMTVRQAILYNVLSAMMAYLGMATGIVIGHYAENVSMWIFALTAGLFMYVALVDMMPEMLHNDAGDHGFSHWGFFCLQNAGILLGFSIMLLIAVFEHRIRLDLGE
uniref:Zinc transporter ZIP6 n=1 Tax=Neogobius melanostomus TaxID=47308 RepID=A0A8C6SFE2_9GOBI